MYIIDSHIFLNDNVVFYFKEKSRKEGLGIQLCGTALACHAQDPEFDPQHYKNK
jgi:hypothetical protein